MRARDVEATAGRRPGLAGGQDLRQTSAPWADPAGHVADRRLDGGERDGRLRRRPPLPRRRAGDGPDGRRGRQGGHAGVSPERARACGWRRAPWSCCAGRPCPRATCWPSPGWRASWRQRGPSELIPLCHPLAVEPWWRSRFAPAEDEPRVDIECTARTEGRTGVEMEALTGARRGRAHRLRHVQGRRPGDGHRRHPSAREAGRQGGLRARGAGRGSGVDRRVRLEPESSR